MADPKSSLVHITDANFEDEVLAAKEPVLVDFWADWCQPCLILGPTIEEIAGEVAGKAKVGKCNIDENPGLAARFQVMSIPTVLVFSGGKPVKSIVGVRPKAQYLTVLAD